MRSCLQIVISLTLTHFLFSYAFFGRFGWLSVTEVLVLAVAVVFYHERATLGISVGCGCSKIVRISSGLSFFHQDIPIVGALAYAGWKHSSLKCLSHKKICRRSVPTITSSPYLPNLLLPTVAITREFLKVDSVTTGAFTSRCNTILNHLVCN